jgi:hypothetical protein
VATDDGVVMNDEVAAVRWVALGDIVELGTDESVKRAVKKIERWRRGQP